MSYSEDVKLTRSVLINIIHLEFDFMNISTIVNSYTQVSVSSSIVPCINFKFKLVLHLC